MSGTRSVSRTEPRIDGGRWPVWKLAALLYPFAALAVAINLFMVGLMGQAIGLPTISPMAALWACGPLGVPAAWLAGRWLRSLLDQAGA